MNSFITTLEGWAAKDPNDFRTSKACQLRRPGHRGQGAQFQVQPEHRRADLQKLHSRLEVGQTRTRQARGDAPPHERREPRVSTT